MPELFRPQRDDAPDGLPKRLSAGEFAEKALASGIKWMNRAKDAEEDAKYWRLRCDVMEDIIARASRLAEADRATMTMQVLREIDQFPHTPALEGRD